MFVEGPYQAIDFGVGKVVHDRGYWCRVDGSQRNTPESFESEPPPEGCLLALEHLMDSQER